MQTFVISGETKIYIYISIYSAVMQDNVIKDNRESHGRIKIITEDSIVVIFF